MCIIDSIQADQSSTVSFEVIPVITYTVAATVAAGNGTVSCNPIIVSAGGSSSCTAVPSAGYQVSGWTGACSATGTATTCTLNNIQADQSTTVSFEAISLSVSATVASGNGTVSCNPTSVAWGSSSTCTAVPDTGSQVSGWTGACAGAGTSETCVLDNIQADQSSTVSFEIAPTYPVNVSVTGLVGSGLTEDSVELQNNGGDPILVTADGTVNFPTELPDGAMYDVTVASQPDNQTCTVANGMGTVSGGPVFGPAVTCVDNSNNISWFATSITFLNGDTGTVTATITCNAGLPLTQSFDISEGSPVEFTVSELKIDAAGTTCEITASDAGYDVLGSANAETPAASCLFNTSNLAVDGRNTC